MRANQTYYDIKIGRHTFRGVADIDEPFEGDMEEPGYPAQCFTSAIYLNGGLIDVGDILDPMMLMKLETLILEEAGYV